MTDRQTVFAANELIMATRALADLLRDTARHLHADSDLSVPERAVLLELRKSGPLTVPELARRREVTRQSTQVTVNPLLAKGLLEKRENPAHRRSPFMALTEAGTALIRAVMRREGDLLADLARNLEPHELHQASETIRRMAAELRAKAPAPAEPKADAATG